MSHDLLVQMAYFYPSGETQKKENFYKYSRGSHKRLRREKMVATRTGCLREWKRVYIFFNSKFLHKTEDFTTRETRNGTSMSPKQSRSVPNLLW